MEKGRDHLFFLYRFTQYNADAHKFTTRTHTHPYEYRRTQTLPPYEYIRRTKHPLKRASIIKTEETHFFALQLMLVVCGNF
jgi:hypothetical protein